MLFSNDTGKLVVKLVVKLVHKDFFCILIVFIPFYLVTDSQMKTILVHTPTHTSTKDSN